MLQGFSIPLPLVLRLTHLSISEAIALVQCIIEGIASSASGDAVVIVPTVGDVRLRSDGQVSWRLGHELPVDHVGRALGRLLGRLVSAAERQGERVPGPVKFAIARTVDDRCLVPLESLEELRTVLRRLGGGDPVALTSQLAERAAGRIGSLRPEPLESAADLRRARRNRGASLSSIAAQTGIPISLLRELEWGMLENWGAGPQTEQSVRAYAEAAGLEADAVMALLALRGTSTVPATAQSVEIVQVRAAAIVSATPLVSRKRQSFWLAAAALPVALALAALLTWTPAEPLPTPAVQATPPEVMPTTLQLAEPPASAPRPVGSGSTLSTKTTSPANVRRVSHSTRNSRSTQPSRARKAKTSFWKRPVLILKFGKE